MLWEEYYDKLGDWATGTAVSRMSQLTTFGPPDEIIDAINTIGFDDEKGATRLLKKATAAGVKFSGDQLSELFLICGEDALNRAIQFSSDQFRTEDLDSLYGFSDEDVLTDIADKQHIPLPESLEDYAEISEDDPEDDAEPAPAPEELAAAYDYILDRLYLARDHLVAASKLSFIDTAGKKRAATVLKYAKLSEAERELREAFASWVLLDFPGKDESLLSGLEVNFTNSTIWGNYLFEGYFTNLMVQKQIRRVLKNTETAYNEIRKLRSKL